MKVKKLEEGYFRCRTQEQWDAMIEAIKKRGDRVYADSMWCNYKDKTIVHILKNYWSYGAGNMLDVSGKTIREATELMELELIAHCPKITITTDGTTTTAKLYDGENIEKTSKAKCSSNDKFDFLTGAKLAVERLGEPNIESNPEAQKFYCVKNNYGIYRFEKGCIYDFIKGCMYADKINYTPCNDSWINAYFIPNL